MEHLHLEQGRMNGWWADAALSHCVNFNTQKVDHPYNHNKSSLHSLKVRQVEDSFHITETLMQVFHEK